MNIPHNRSTDNGFEPCDGDMVDIGTMVAPHRYLCVKCRAVRTPNGELNGTEVESVEPAIEGDRPGWSRRILQALFRWIW